MASFTLETHQLAEEFEVSPTVMDAFLNRFSPDRTSDDQFKAASDVMLFLHIPKTAGMSVGKALRDAFHQFRPVDWENVPSSFRYAMRHALYMQTREKARQVIMGHFGWPELAVWKSHELPLKCGTILRDPLTRTVSNFKYNSSDAHPAAATFISRYPTLLSYAEAVPIDMQLTLAVGYIDSFETALRKFNAYYSFLGVTEHLGRSLSELSRTHGLPPLTEHRQNVGQVAPDPDLPAEVRSRVEARSHNDRKMHRLLSRLYSRT